MPSLGKMLFDRDEVICSYLFGQAKLVCVWFRICRRLLLLKECCGSLMAAKVETDFDIAPNVCFVPLFCEIMRLLGMLSYIFAREFFLIGKV